MSRRSKMPKFRPCCRTFQEFAALTKKAISVNYAEKFVRFGLTVIKTVFFLFFFSTCQLRLLLISALVTSQRDWFLSLLSEKWSSSRNSSHAHWQNSEAELLSQNFGRRDFFIVGDLCCLCGGTFFFFFFSVFENWAGEKKWQNGSWELLYLC